METLKDGDADAHSPLRRAVLFALAGEGILTLMDTVIKSLTPRYPTFEIAFMRFAMGSIVAGLMCAVMRPGWPTRDALKFHSMRAVLAVMTACAFFYGLSKVPVAEAMALSFLTPLFVALFGVVLLKEYFDKRMALALLAGLAGMAVIVSGQMSAASYTIETLKGAGSITFAAIIYALVMVLLRARANIDPLPQIITIQNIGPALLLIPAAAWVWTPIATADFGWFALAGVLGVSGHMCIAHAFKRAEAATLAPVHYTVLIWGIIWGGIFFGDIPGLATLTGAAMIAVAAFMAERRKR